MRNIKSLLIVITVTLFVACNNETPQKEHGIAKIVINKDALRQGYINQIKRWEADMHYSMQLDNVVAGQAIKAYTDFVKAFPDDSLSPDFLFKSGEITTATKQYPQSLMFYQNITDKYPKYNRIDAALFLQGFLLDSYINDDAKAKVIYEQVIAKYPASVYAEQAKMAIKNLGKSDEELIKEFRKKNGQK